jgi:hypothetical protein
MVPHGLGAPLDQAAGKSDGAGRRAPNWFSRGFGRRGLENHRHGMGLGVQEHRVVPRRVVGVTDGFEDLFGEQGPADQRRIEVPNDQKVWAFGFIEERTAGHE